MSADRPAQSEPPGNGFEICMALALAVAVVAGVVVFGGAWLAATLTGGRVSGGLEATGGAAIGLVRTPGDPAAAWGPNTSGLPGPALYWMCTGAVAVVVVGLLVVALVLWRRTRSPGRVRFGVDTDAHQARPRDVKTLRVPSTLPPQGRFLLGRMAPKGPLLATEDRERHPLKGKAARRQGNRGSVALLGPTQAGKTVLLSGGIVGWDGPVVALSVKRDLYDLTASARSSRGDLAVFDPGSSTGLATARWTPLRGVTTASGALRAGRALAAAIPRNGVQGGDYWAQQGEMFVSAYMALAGLSHLVPNTDGSRRQPLTIGRLTAWAFRGVGITDPTVNELVKVGLRSSDLETQLLAQDAGMKLMALHQEDPRIRASIYATARLAFEAFAEPTVAHSASLDPRARYDSDELWQQVPRFIDLDWVMSGDQHHANTLYLIAPDTEFKRLAPVLGGLLGDLREQIHAWDIQGRRLDKPLLFVIDEAAQLELSWLPEEVSTIAGLGGMFVTCWQSKAQIDHRYGTLTDAVLGGHRSKIVLNGCDDPSTLNWLAKVGGTEHVARRGWSTDSRGGRSVSQHLQSEELVAAHVVRQMWPGEAVLVHGTLPPIHLRSVPWWKDKQLSALVTTGPDGRPQAPQGVNTCPTTEKAPEPGTAGIDRSALQESTTHLPPADRGATSGSGSNGTRQRKQRSAQQPTGPAPTLFEDSDPPTPSTTPTAPTLRVIDGSTPPDSRAAVKGHGSNSDHPDPLERPERDSAPIVTLNKIGGRCVRCHRWLFPNQGQVLAYGHGERLVCHPHCEVEAAGPDDQDPDTSTTTPGA